jgi:hypothetical protein
MARIMIAQRTGRRPSHRIFRSLQGLHARAIRRLLRRGCPAIAGSETTPSGGLVRSMLPLPLPLSAVVVAEGPSEWSGATGAALSSKSMFALSPVPVRLPASHKASCPKIRGDKREREAVSECADVPHKRPRALLVQMRGAGQPRAGGVQPPAASLTPVLWIPG